MWPGKAEPTQYLVNDLKNDPDLSSKDRKHLAPHSFHIFYSKRLGNRFTQQTNFISDLEKVVPEFYKDIGSALSAWVKSAPKVKKEKNMCAYIQTCMLMSVR